MRLIRIIIFLFDFVQTGNLSENISLSENVSDIFQKQKNLKGVWVRAVAPEGNLTQGEVVFKTQDGQLYYDSGFGVDVLYSLQIALGFQIQVITAKGWATQYPNGSWFGMAQQIIDEEADLSIAKTSILPNRAQALFYLIPTHGLGLYAFFVQPPAKSGRNIFLEPFGLNLWISLIVTYLILAFTIIVLSFLAMPTIGLNYEDYALKNNTFIWTFCSICQHGFYSSPTLISLRISLISGVILGLILYVSYSAQLVSMFSIESVPIKSMIDLLHSKIHITIDRNSVAAKSVLEITGKESKDPISGLLREQLKGHKHFLLSAQDGGSLVLNAAGGFLSLKDTFYTTTRNSFGTEDDELCKKVSTVPVTDAKFKSGLFVRKGSPFKEPFNVKIIAMYNFGLMTRFVKKYEETYLPLCDSEQFIRSAPIIDLDDVIIAIYSFIGAIVFSIVLCLMEMLYNKRIRSSVHKF